MTSPQNPPSSDEPLPPQAGESAPKELSGDSQNPYQATATTAAESTPVPHSIQTVGLMVGTSIYVAIFLAVVWWVQVSTTALQIRDPQLLSWWGRFAVSPFPVALLTLLLVITIATEFTVRHPTARRVINYVVIAFVMVFSVLVILSSSFPKWL